MNNAVILFIFNRPDHTKKVIDGLKENNIEKLYVFSDGPRNKKDNELVQKTRDIVNGIDWCEVEAEYKDVNIGLAESVIQGITKVFSKGYDTVTVLEDDCVPNASFISFMEQSFKFYNDNEQVMHISGFGLPIKRHTKSDIYLTPYPCSWGWGTWREYWEQCDFYQEEKYRNLLNDPEKVRDFDYSGNAFSEFLQMQLDKQVNSWLIRWYFYIHEHSGRCVWNYQTLIENNGFDGSGAHNNRIDRFNQKNIGDRNINMDFRFEQDMQYNKRLIREFRRHFMGKSYIEKIKTSIYLLTGLIIGK
ncbi:hypothetical protein bcgnr5406_27970 [Bacillus cereus]